MTPRLSDRAYNSCSRNSDYITGYHHPGRVVHNDGPMSTHAHSPRGLIFVATTEVQVAQSRCILLDIATLIRTRALS
jgi:hypothetical protein